MSQHDEVAVLRRADEGFAFQRDRRFIQDYLARPAERGERAFAVIELERLGGVGQEDSQMGKIGSVPVSGL